MYTSLSDSLQDVSSAVDGRKMPRRLCSLALAVLTASVLFGLFSAGCGEDDPDPAGSTVPSWTGDPVVRTVFGTAGGIAGRANTWVWKAIPFARPPVGPLRWKAPRDPEPWEGVRERSEYCEPCPQWDFTGTRTYGSEDCLYLNIWRPRTAETNLPVYFWIHGGGNSLGTAGIEDYNGANLASRSNVVVVTVQYRLGPLGWFAHPALRQGIPGSEEDDSGNYGTLDLIQALSWVRRNIEAFGGDPQGVMIAGESAGGINVLSLLISPAAEGLFQRAMVESGIAQTSTVEEAEESARQAIVNLLVNDGTAAGSAQAEAHLQGMSASEIEAYLRSKSADQLLRAYEVWALGMIRIPNVLTDGTVLPETGYATLEAGTYPNKVPILIGSNKEELKLFLFADPFFSDKEDLYQVVASYGSDGWKVMGVDQVARKLSSHADQPGVYAYQFRWGSVRESGESQLPDPWGFTLGSFHALEIPFFFGNEALFVALHHLLFTAANRAGREVLSDAMMRYAAEFAHRGDPNAPGSGLPEWQPWSNEAGGPKCILFDVDENQALDIQMSTVELTAGGVAERMAVEVPEPVYSQAVEYLEQWGSIMARPE